MEINLERAKNRSRARKCAPYEIHGLLGGAFS
jgi:hypothetical protein